MDTWCLYPARDNNVTWVRAFRFVLGLWKSYLNGSFIDIIQSLKLYVDIDLYKLTPKIIFQIKKLSENIFNSIDNHDRTCSVIENFNIEIQKAEYIDLRQTILGIEFKVPIFDELDQERLVEDLYIHIPSECKSAEIQTAIDAFTKKSSQNIAYEFIS